MDVPAELIRAMAAMWNNGPKITQVNDIQNDSPAGFAHSQNSRHFNNILKPDWDIAPY